DVDVGELRDQHRHSLTRPQWPRPTGPPQPAHAPPPHRTDCQARAGSGTGVPKRGLRLLPNGAARSPSSEARVRTSGSRPARVGKRTAGIVTASGTLPTRSRSRGSRFKGRQGMEALTQMRCVACRKDAPTVTDAELAEFQRQVADWEIVELDGIKRLKPVFLADVFAQALK